VIPLDSIAPGNLYSQDDAPFLLGEGFTPEAAREAICGACRSGQIAHREWRRRYWFTGRAFLEWVGREIGVEVALQRAAPEPENAGDRLDHAIPMGHDHARRFGTRSPTSGKEVSE